MHEKKWYEQTTNRGWGSWAKCGELKVENEFQKSWTLSLSPLIVSSTQLLYENFSSEIEKQLNFHFSENLRDSIFSSAAAWGSEQWEMQWNQKFVVDFPTSLVVVVVVYHVDIIDDGLSSLSLFLHDDK